MQFLSPQSFLFSVFYVFLLFLLFCRRNFFIFWIIIELRTLVFIGVSYSLFKNNFSSLLLFFIIQSLSAFSILLFYFSHSTLGFTLSLLLKLSIFPFFYWYINLLPNFPNSMFFFSRTLFKLPSVFILINFYYIIRFLLLFFSAIFTIFLGAVIITIANDLRFVLICSSVVNNSWFMFSQYVRSFLFIAYFTLYSTLLFYLLCLITTQSNYSFAHLLSNSHLVLLCLFTIAGLPPFPLFFIKIVLVYCLILSSFSSLYIFFLMLARVLTMLGYLKHVFNSLLNSNITHFYLVI